MIGVAYIDKDNNKILINTAVGCVYQSNCCINMIREIMELRIKYIYVWEAQYLFKYIDLYAGINKLDNYEDLKSENKNKKFINVNNNCISYKDNNNKNYERKIWLKTENKQTGDRHKRLHATTFINLSLFFGHGNIKKLFKSFDISLDNISKGLYSLLVNYNKYIKNLTNLNWLKEDGGPSTWTLGGLSKRYYLKLYSPNSKTPFKDYKDRNPQSKIIEYELRDYNLLLPGILYIKNNNTHYNLYKYDVNSLFPYIERDTPFISMPRVTTYEDYLNNKDNKLIYIFCFDNLSLKLKDGYPSLFKPPNTHLTQNNNIIFLEQQAFFDFYFEELLNFYEIIDCESIKVYKMRTTKDRAIEQYVDTLYPYKIEAKRESALNPLYTTVKLLINNLHGKFAQLTQVEEYTYDYDNENKIINKTLTRIRDDWSQSHFDYIRGAFIYCKTNAHILKCINNLKALCFGEPLKNHIFYMDTDSVLTDIEPNHFNKCCNLSNTELGAWKIEENYKNFKVFAPKIYGGYNFQGNFKLTCAGYKSDDIIKHLTLNYPNKNYLDVLSEGIEVPFIRYACKPDGIVKNIQYVLFGGNK